MTIKDMLKDHNFQDKNFIVAVSVNPSDDFDAVVMSPGLSQLFLKKETDLNKEISEGQRAFCISIEAWERMTKKNIWINQLKNGNMGNTDGDL